MALFKISKGSASSLNNQPKTEGYCWFTTDDGKFYIDVSNSVRQVLNAGHADTAAKLSTARTISLTGDVSGSASFDGSSNISIEVTIPEDDSGLSEPIILTETISYGTALPTEGEFQEGQLFFISEEDGEISSLPNGGTAGQYLIKQSDEDGDAAWGNLPSLNYLPLTGGTITGTTASTSTSTGALIVKGGVGVGGNLYASKVYGAVWNDYAEYRICKEDFKAGQVVCENNDDTLSISSSRLQPGANIVSDTFGFAIGETKEAKCPIAVSGRVLAYPYESRDMFNAGDAVCAGPNGTVSLMTREEIREYPERIIGTVSAVPAYEFWGENNIKVNNRIWIKVR